MGGSKLSGPSIRQYPSWVTVEYTAITIKGFRVRVSVFDALNLCRGAIGLQSAPMGKCATKSEENGESETFCRLSHSTRAVYGLGIRDDRAEFVFFSAYIVAS